MNQSIRRPPLPWLPVAVLLLACGTGCTSVLTSASLRDLVWDGDGHAAETAPSAADAATDDAPDSPEADSGAADEATADAQRRKAAVEEATARLARLDHLDEAARATLTETLERTHQEDWPAVIDAFAESLADAGMTPSPAAEAETITETPGSESSDGDATGGETTVATAAKPELPDAHVVAKADLDATQADAAAISPETVAAPEPQPTLPTDEAATADEPELAAAAPERAPLPPTAAVSPPRSLAIENACFASRVQAWGVLDRFAADRFRPGQEVIVYFELDGLSAGESPAGHTTCIDSELRLVDAGGSLIHAWSFEPIAETCRARRRDYFARYVVQLPETGLPGACQVELRVTDTLSGEVATASLPLEVVANAPAP